MAQPATPSYLDALAALYSELRLPYLIHEEVFWHCYQGMAEPRHPIQEPIRLSEADATAIRKQLNARLIRWTNPLPQGQPAATQKGWYAVVCYRNVDLEQLKSKQRRSILKALEEHQLRRITVEEMAESGFEVYRKALAAYGGQKPPDPNAFARKVQIEQAFPDLVHYIGVFREQQLVGYTKCYQFGTKEALIAETKYDPAFLRFRISEALTYYRNQYFLEERAVGVLRSGFRRLAHDTNVQSFYERFNFQQEPLDLQIRYQFPLGWLVRLLRPAQGILVRPAPALAALLEQDRYRS